METELTFN